MKRNKTTIKYFQYLACIVLSYFLFFNMYITSDVATLSKYDNLSAGLKPNFVSIMLNGRIASYPIECIIKGIFFRMGITYINNAWILQFIGMCVYAYCALVVFNIFFVFACSNDYVKVTCIDICIMIMFVNPFITETYTYGSLVWAVGILLACIAARELLCKRYVLGVILTVASASYYQVDVFITMILCISFYVIKGIRDNQLKINIYRIICTLLLGLISCGISYLEIKLANRLFIREKAIKELSGDSIFTNIHRSYRGIRRFLLTTYGLAPDRFTFIVLLVFLSGGIFVILKEKSKISYVFIWIVYCLVVIVMPYSLGFVGATPGNAPHRVVFSEFVSLGCIMLSVYLLGKHLTIHSIESLASIGTIVVFVVFFAYTEMGIVDCYIQQAIDKREVNAIKSEIDLYEMENSVRINEIKTRSDASPLYSYDEQLLDYFGTSYSHRMLGDPWSQGNYLNLMCHTKYKTNPMTDEEYLAFFGEGSWDTFNPSEQLRFEGDVVYWAVY